jgi:hypothetical protein
MNILSQIYFALLRFFHFPNAPYNINRCEDLPEHPIKNTLYVLGVKSKEWSVGLLCPCGCNNVIQLNLLKSARPCWELETFTNGLATLTPSIWRKVGCKSHFFFIKGKIKWCDGGQTLS